MIEKVFSVIRLKMKLLEVAKEAVFKSGDILVKNYGKLSPDDIDEKAINDFVTRVDMESEECIKDTIWKHFPDHDILAEETGLHEKSENYRWIVDPLDGTRNYMKGFPVFAVSIAVEFNRTIIVGAVYDPLRKELYWAEKGKGAYLNNRRIYVSKTNKLRNALIGTGFPFRAKEHLDMYLRSFKSVFINVSGIRRLGSAALDLCYTARGLLDGFWEFFLAPWDVAAGTLIIEEAGGIVSDIWGTNLHIKTGHIVGGNSLIQPPLQKIIENSVPEFKKHASTG